MAFSPEVDNKRRGLSRLTGPIADRLHARNKPAQEPMFTDQAHKVDVAHSDGFPKRRTDRASLPTAPDKLGRISRRETTTTRTTTRSVDTTTTSAPIAKPDARNTSTRRTGGKLNSVVTERTTVDTKAARQSAAADVDSRVIEEDVVFVDRGRGRLAGPALIAASIVLLAGAVWSTGGEQTTANATNSSGGNGMPPSGPTEKATPTPSSAATGALKPADIPASNPDQAKNPDLNLKTVEIGDGTPEAAAAMFGADPYSKNKDHWEILENGKAAHLKDTPDGKASRVNLIGTFNGVTQKAVVEGYLQIQNRVDKVQFPNPSQTEVLSPDQYPQADLTGGTFRVYENTKAGFNDLWRTVHANETDPQSDKYQKDVNVYEGCVINHHEAVTTPIVSLTTDQAANLLGMDKYSQNKNNWEVNEWKGLHLKETPDHKTSRVRLNVTIDGVTYYAVAEGYFELPRANNIKNPSQTEVVDGRVYDYVDYRGGTLWFSKEEYMDENFNKISQEVYNKETNQKLPNGKDNPDYQENVIVYEFGKCEPSDQTPSATPTPTPTPIPTPSPISFRQPGFRDRYYAPSARYASAARARQGRRIS